MDGKYLAVVQKHRNPVGSGFGAREMTRTFTDALQV
jgi:hypothetical protein